MRERFFSFLALAGILYACQRDEDEPAVNRQFTFDNARAWYEAHKPGYFELKLGGNEFGYSILSKIRNDLFLKS